MITNYSHNKVWLSVLAIIVTFRGELVAQVVPDNAIRGRERIQIQRFEIQIMAGDRVSGRGNEMTDVGAALKTDPELEAILEQAERFRGERQYGVASKLWQSVLQRSGDALYSSDGQIYYSLAHRVEWILSELSVDDGLATYRVTADAFAKQIMAEAPHSFDIRSLRQVVRDYFLSSFGDDAALRLSAIYMDEHDFVGAIRMLEKIATLYPDPSVSLAEVFTRMALCHAMMGARSDAQLAVKKARQATGQVDPSMLSAIEATIQRYKKQPTAKLASTGSSMPLADRNRSGVLPGVPANNFARQLHAVWQYAFEPDAKRWSDLRRQLPIWGDEALKMASESVSPKERQMIDQWRRYHWRPSGELIFDGSRVYVKTAMDLVAWNRNVSSGTEVWRSLWRNHYEMDEFTSTMMELQRRINRGQIELQSLPKGPARNYEIQLFTDRIGSQLSIQDGVVYSIEGARFDIVVPERMKTLNAPFGFSARRSRTNYLTAYDAQTGRLLWTLPSLDYGLKEVGSGLMIDQASDAERNDLSIPVSDGGQDTPWISSGGFMSAPILYGGLLLIPVNQGGSIVIYALDPAQQGKTVWTSFLCDESDSGANPNSPIQLSIEGSDLFVSTGLGVVFVLDPTTGLIHFAKRYERAGRDSNDILRRLGRSIGNKTYDSWMSDTVIGFGRQMVCMSSDAKGIEAHDRRTGELIWRAEFRPLEAKIDYLLGVYDGVLYAAGPETILAFSLLDEGRMLWGGRRLFDGRISCGRGMLTTDGVYVPAGDQIFKFSLRGAEGDAELLAQAKVELGTGAPVGNLFSDGERIWVHGANRVYALGPAPKIQPTSEENPAK